MESSSTAKLLAQLKDPDQLVREEATVELWRRWFEQKGSLGFELLRRAQIFLEIGKVAQARELLVDTVAIHPDFAEAWNRLAVLYFLLEDYEKSRDTCQQVVELNPIHFGAWHGLGLCNMALGDYKEAISALQKALEIQPYASENKRLLLECQMNLS